jgi:hypothetical protein
MKLKSGLACVFIVGSVAIVGCHPKDPMTAPKSYVAFEALDKSFKGMAPEGWKVQRSGLQGTLTTAKISRLDASINIVSDLQGSLMGDMMTATNNQMGGLTEGSGVNLPAPKPAVEKLHAAGKARLEKKYENEDYEEKAMQNMQTKLGEARYSEFTAKGVHGFRVTILASDRLFQITEVGDADEWTILQPIFAKVVAELAPGTN